MTARLTDRRPRGTRAIRCVDCRSALPDDYQPAPRTQNRCQACAAAFAAGPGPGGSGSTRDRRLRARFGITEAQLAELIKAQQGVCALCRTAPATHLDHCHQSGAVRGVLCPGCNGALGSFGDTITAVEQALAYLAAPAVALNHTPPSRIRGPETAPPPAAELRRAYLENLWSLEHIAQLYGVTRPVVTHWLRHLDLPVRSRGEGAAAARARKSSHPLAPGEHAKTSPVKAARVRRRTASWAPGEPPPLSSHCQVCDRTLPMSEFYIGRSDGGKRSYVFPRCKPCTTAFTVARRAERYGDARTHRLRQTYGLTRDQVNQLIEAASGKCGICRRRAARVVDHDHHTGKVRGLLCDRCNSALGWLGDSVEGVRRALHYLTTGPALTLDRPGPLPRRSAPLQHTPPDAERLRELYEVRGLSIAGTATELGVSADTAERWLHASGIAVRTPAASRWRTALGAPGDTDWQRFRRLLIETDDGCWLWQGKGAATGRSPRFTVDGKEDSAIRYAYAEVHSVELPRGQRLLRTCSTPTCVAPAHRRLRRGNPASVVTPVSEQRRGT